MSSNLPPLPFPGSSVSTNDIRPIKSPLEIANPWLWVWWGIAAVLAVLLAWWIWRRRKAKQTEIVPVVIIPPHERAREKLREALALINQPRPFCITVSDTIRVYLEERFRLNAPDRTTDEFLDELPQSATLSFDQKQTLGEFLQCCDLVKFARYEPPEEELRRLYESAVRLIDETEPSFNRISDPAQVPRSAEDQPA